MIIDTIGNASLYRGMSDRLALALDYLKKTAFSGMRPGRYELDGDRVYALVQHRDTRPRKGSLWEAHRRYIDIQYVFEGLELMGYANIRTLKVVEEYEESKEALMLRGKGDFVTVPAGTFVIFFPEDAHMPSIALKEPQPVKKVVVKVMM